MKKFDDNEIRMIKDAFELRRKNSDIQHIKKLEIITSKLLFPIKELTSLQRAIISGCVKELIIYPNEEMLSKTDYELLVSRNEIEKKCLNVDIGLKILNKINKRTEQKLKLFEQTFEKIDKLSNSKQVYYSITNDGKIYKAGIMTEKDKGMFVGLNQTSTICNFEIGFISKNSFTKTSKPNEIVSYLREYEKVNKLTENHKRFIKIFENDIH